MIHYDLICDDGHRFDGWFNGAAAFEAQNSAGEVKCPYCGSAAVAKALMAPAIAGVRRGEQDTPGQEPEKPAAVPEGNERAQVLTMLRELKEKLVSEADYVGPRFAEEARRIHYDEAPARGIYGEASADEARSLIDEGIEFHPLPILPDERN